MVDIMTDFIYQIYDTTCEECSELISSDLNREDAINRLHSLTHDYSEYDNDDYISFSLWSAPIGLGSYGRTIEKVEFNLNDDGDWVKL